MSRVGGGKGRSALPASPPAALAPPRAPARGWVPNDGVDVHRPRLQGAEMAGVVPLTRRAPSPVIGAIALATKDDLEGVERIQRQHGFDPEAEDPPPAGGWLMGMPSLYELQNAADCAQHVWVAKDADDPDRVIGSFAVSAPFTMSRPLSSHKFVVPLPPSLEAAFRTFGVRYVSRAMVDDDPTYRRTGIMHSMFSEVLDSDVYAPTPCLAHIAIDPPNAASEAFFRAQGWKLIGYTANHADPAKNTGLPVSEQPVIGGLWVRPPPQVFVPEVEGTAREVVDRHPVEPGETSRRFVPAPRRETQRALRSVGDFLEYGSMLREARAFARSGRDKLAQRPLAPGEVIYERVPQPQVDAR